MQPSFTIATPTSIHFGAGVSGKLASLLPAQTDRVILVRGASGAASAPVVNLLAQCGVAAREVAAPAEPSVASVNEAYDQVRRADASAVIACGGGSVIDTGKALRVCLELGRNIPEDFSTLDPALLNGDASRPLIAIPTTAGTGAEVTSNAVLGTGAAKISLRGRMLFPSCALVDPGFLASAPRHIIVGAGLDAVTQTFEAHTSRLATRYTLSITEPNLRLGAEALRNIVLGQDEDAQMQLAWVSLSSGMALSNGGLGAAHGLAAVIGGKTDAPHGMLCGRLLGPVLRKNHRVADRASDVYRRLDRCMSVLADVFPPTQSHDALSGFDTWLEAQHVPRLRSYCPNRSAFGEIAAAAVSASSSTKNAVPLQAADFLDILDAAY